MKNKGGFTFTGRLDLPYLYNDIFGVIPSEYNFKYNEEDDDTENDKEFDLHKITKEFILNMFPDAEVACVMGKFKERVVSCAANEKSKEEIHYGGVYLNGEWHPAEMRVLLRGMRVLFDIIGDGVSVLYDAADASFDPEEFMDQLIEKLPTKTEDENDYPSIGLVGLNNSGYYTIESEINPTKIDIDKNYNDDFKEAYDAITGFIESDERKSGLILLNGEPGTGKTYFLRHLITKFEKKDFVLITPSIAAKLASPDFIEFLIANKDSIFILEDCEQVIIDRKNNSFSSAVSSVLNMSDGLMSDIFNGKFICTFNADTAVIDDAIMRKGRCFAKYSFGKLCEKKAKALLKERGVDIEHPGDMTLADIYNYEVKNVDDSKTKKKIGF